MSEASVAIRLNPFKTLSSKYSSEDLGVLSLPYSTVPWSPWCRVLSERPSFTRDPLFHAGCYYVQDSSAAFVGHLFRKVLKNYEGQSLRVLDLCASPGGKTTDIAASLREKFGDNWSLISNEVIKNRAGVLKDNVCTWGDPNVIVTSVDPAAFRSFEGYFDIIVADVPCSGEGMFRKYEHLEEQWSSENVNLCAARQKRIVADVWPALKNGGTMIYSTCTYQDAENDGVMRWAESELGAEIVPPEDEFGAWGVELTTYGSLLRAGVVPGEGQWGGIMMKNSATRQSKQCLEKLNIVWSGFIKYEHSQKKNAKSIDNIPDPNLPLMIGFDEKSYPSVEVDKQTALKYLHRDSLILKDVEKGYLVIRYMGQALGFVKNIGSRCNNLLPKGRRILVDV